jgi:hypothetical protein
MISLQQAINDHFQKCIEDVRRPKPAVPQTLLVGISADGRDVVIQHPRLEQDGNGVGWLRFTPEQAIGLARSLTAKATEIRGGGADAEGAR